MYNILVFFISLIPIQKIKIFFYKILGIKINGSCKIGFFIFLNCKEILLNNSKLGSFIFISARKVDIKNSNLNKFNYFKNIHEIKIHDSSLGSFNKFISDKKHKKNNNNLNIKKTEIGKKNLFDLTSSISLKKAKIFDFNQLWTHGFNVYRKINIANIIIENNITINNM